MKNMAKMVVIVLLDGPKMAPRWPKMAPEWLQDGLKMTSRWPQGPPDPADPPPDRAQVDKRMVRQREDGENGTAIVFVKS